MKRCAPEPSSGSQAKDPIKHPHHSSPEVERGWKDAKPFSRGGAWTSSAWRCCFLCVHLVTLRGVVNDDVLAFSFLHHGQSLYPGISRRRITFHAPSRSGQSGAICGRELPSGPAIRQIMYRASRGNKASSMHKIHIQSIVSCVTKVMTEHSLNI
jgi:hypothetical protein